MHREAIYVAKVEAAGLGLRRCPECGEAAQAMAPSWAEEHTIRNGLVIVGCEGYWTVDPAAVGLERGQWEAE